MSDLIKRKDAVTAINKALDRETLLNRFVRKIAIDAIIQVPSAERPQGEWIEGEIFYFCGEQQLPMKCSVCGRTALNEPWTFCPNCGAKMDGERKESER